MVKVKRLYVFGLKQMCVRESGSPNSYFFFVSHTVSVTTILALIITIEEEWRKKYFREFSLPLAMC